MNGLIPGTPLSGESVGYRSPEDAPRTHVPEMEQRAENQRPKVGVREERLFRYDGTDLYQWFAKPGRDSQAREWSVFEEPQDAPFLIRSIPAPEAAREEGAMAFGFGRFVVDTGCFQQTPAVFICPVDEPGQVGASARHLGQDRHSLLPGERVMTFPTVDQARAVADALVGAAIRPQAPAPEAAREEGGSTDDLVDRFAVALKEKLRASEAKYGFGDAWKENGWQYDCIADLNRHLEKGDPRDVAAYCAFAWHHGWSTALRPQAPATAPSDVDGAVEGIRARIATWDGHDASTVQVGVPVHDLRVLLTDLTEAREQARLDEMAFGLIAEGSSPLKHLYPKTYRGGWDAASAINGDIARDRLAARTGGA